MKTYLELTEKLSCDLTLFERMKAAATELLNQTETERYSQAIVLFSANGEIYGTAVKNACEKERKEEKALVDRLKACGDTEIRYGLCLWADQNPDLPSFAFRKALLELNQKNGDTLWFVRTADGISTVRCAATVK